MDSWLRAAHPLPPQAHPPVLQAQAHHQAAHQAAHRQAHQAQAHRQALQAPLAQVRNSVKSGLNPHGQALRTQHQPKTGETHGMLLLLLIHGKMMTGEEPKLEAAAHHPHPLQAHHQAPQAAHQAAPQAALQAAHLQAPHPAQVLHPAQAQRNEINTWKEE
jgi:hypothetical protein